MQSKDIDYYLDLFSRMNRAIMRGKQAPHKPILLLAILNLVRKGIISSNKIVLTDELMAEFKRLWINHIGLSTDTSSVTVADGLTIEVTNKYPFKCSIENPYFHLSNEPFWRLVKSERYTIRKSYSSIRMLRDNFSHAEIDEELYSIMCDNSSQLEDHLIYILNQ